MGKNQDQQAKQLPVHSTGDANLTLTLTQAKQLPVHSTGDANLANF